jgi:hypothetical protein
MHEQLKLEDASHFYDEMVTTQNDPAVFRRKLSAFLSSARSVLQYAFKEAKAKTGGESWYNNAIAGRPAIKLMKDQRDSDIHAEPVRPNNDVSVRVGGVLPMTGTLGIIAFNNKGEVTETRDAASAEPIHPSAVPTSAEYKYYFPNHRANGDVLSLARTYITDLQQVISDGTKKGFISK